VRILFATTRGAGHFGPLVPFARACERAGHEVLVAGAPSVRPHVERAGLALVAVDEPSDEIIDPVWQRVRAAAPDEADRIVLEEIFAGEFARSALPRMLATMRDWRPDVVLYETCEFASVVAAEHLGVPRLHVSVLLAARGKVDLSRLDAPVERLRAEAGLRRDPQVPPFWAEPYVTLAPRSLEGPSSRTPRGTRRYREPAGPALPLPDWWDASDDPLVYVSFGSAAAGNGFYPDLYRRALDAIDGLPVRVLLTLGTEVDPAELGPTPPSVHVEPWVPQNAVMSHAAAMVGHGGSGSTLMAMAAGMPLAVVPLFADQPHNADCVAALGAGVRVEPDRLPDLRETVEALLAEPGYRDAAGRVAAEIAAQPPVDEVVGWVERLACGEVLAA
jgi:UDP:flavonoid glycosyltransferase YjiC (YdhE family)